MAFTVSVSFTAQRHLIHIMHVLHFSDLKYSPPPSFQPYGHRISHTGILPSEGIWSPAQEPGAEDYFFFSWSLCTRNPISIDYQTTALPAQLQCPATGFLCPAACLPCPGPGWRCRNLAMVQVPDKPLGVFRPGYILQFYHSD